MEKTEGRGRRSERAERERERERGRRRELTTNAANQATASSSERSSLNVVINDLKPWPSFILSFFILIIVRAYNYNAHFFYRAV